MVGCDCTLFRLARTDFKAELGGNLAWWLGSPVVMVIRLADLDRFRLLCYFNQIHSDRPYICRSKSNSAVVTLPIFRVVLARYKV
jgi:hypothetical protein